MTTGLWYVRGYMKLFKGIQADSQPAVHGVRKVGAPLVSQHIEV